MVAPNTNAKIAAQVFANTAKINTNVKIAEQDIVNTESIDICAKIVMVR